MSFPSIPDDQSADAHQLRLEFQGYTIIKNALPPDFAKRLSQRMSELLPTHGGPPTGANPNTPSRDIERVWEADAMFEDLMDWPTVFPVISRYMRGDITLLGTSIANFMPRRSAARAPWHRDGPYVRLTYYLVDVAEETGPTGVYPGTHRSPDNPPKWFNTDDGQPRNVPGMVKAAAKAGDCMVNDTLLWHTSTPNESDLDRKIVWIVYKKASQELTDHRNLRNTDAFLARQTKPLRRKLCGLA